MGGYPPSPVPPPQVDAFHTKLHHPRGLRAASESVHNSRGSLSRLPAHRTTHSQRTTPIRKMMSFFGGGGKVALPEHNCVLPHALKVPALEKLVGKRVVLVPRFAATGEVALVNTRTLDCRLISFAAPDVY